MVRHSFSYQHRDLMTGLITPAMIYVPNGKVAVPVRAMWDTGASLCQITERMAKKMQLVSLGQRYFDTANGRMQTNIYELGLYLSPTLNIRKLYFGEVYGESDFDILIGMSLISRGRFTLDGQGDARTLTFEI